MTADNWQTGNVFCDLSHLGLLKLSGEDARSFLQGQVSNDVNQLNDSTAHLSAYCSPKGRMLALFLAFAQGDDLFLQLDSGITDAVAKRLKMYVMRAKVDITDVSQDLARIGISGSDAESLLGKQYATLPTENYAAATIDRGLLIKLPSVDGQQRYEIVIAADKAAALHSALAADFSQVEQAEWGWLDIQAGVPDIYTETQQQFVPQMVNLDILGGINFKKGCYTGQEIVARTHYLGSVKRRTYLTHIASDISPKAGDTVQDGAQSDVGQIVRVAANPTGGFDALIEMRIEAQASGQVQWQDTAISFKDLPYSLATADVA